jgi:hypothetical protein
VYSRQSPPKPLGAHPVNNDDLSSLRLSEITIPGILVPVPPTFNPAAGLNEVSTNVDLRPSLSLFVNIDAALDPANRTLTWTFTSIDPLTGLPPDDPAVGFLPAGTEGGVVFSIRPNEALPTGAQITNQGSVRFDFPPPESTRTWTNTIDNTPPASRVLPLDPMQTSTNFTVAWTGTDEGSGVGDFTIYVSDNGGPFTAWLTNTTDTSGSFTGVDGHTYGFYSIARDLAGNSEPAKTDAEASTQVQINPAQK